MALARVVTFDGVAGETPGQRTGVAKYEVAMRMAASS